MGVPELILGWKLILAKLALIVSSKRDPRRFFEVGGVERDFRWFGKIQPESTTMNDVLTVVGAGEDDHSQIKDIMDTEDGILSYDY
jgi:hypothetical protein